MNTGNGICKYYVNITAIESSDEIISVGFDNKDFKSYTGSKVNTELSTQIDIIYLSKSAIKSTLMVILKK